MIDREAGGMGWDDTSPVSTGTFFREIVCLFLLFGLALLNLD